MSQATSVNTGKPFGLKRVCQVLKLPARRSTPSVHAPRPWSCPGRLSGVDRSPRSPTPACTRLSGPTWSPRRSPAKATARCGPGCAGCGLCVSPEPGSCG